MLICAIACLRPDPVLGQSPQPSASDCATVVQALAAYRAIKPGIVRREVEKSFKYDGGLQARERSRYTYQGCPYIKVEIDFEDVPAPGVNSNSEDVVTRISKLFIDYPTMD